MRSNLDVPMYPRTLVCGGLCVHSRTRSTSDPDSSMWRSQGHINLDAYGVVTPTMSSHLVIPFMSPITSAGPLR